MTESPSLNFVSQKTAADDNFSIRDAACIQLAYEGNSTIQGYLSLNTPGIVFVITSRDGQMFI